mmetsp:Transcript_108804/g.216073  ORF Transcript_108804/g.216073 Transcript_108804/m.216073 type:complete len:96 (+) Transcript_108804:403-690(+)
MQTAFAAAITATTAALPLQLSRISGNPSRVGLKQCPLSCFPTPTPPCKDRLDEFAWQNVSEFCNEFGHLWDIQDLGNKRDSQYPPQVTHKNISIG